MSIKPLDLQTTFARMGEISKEQSKNQQAAAQQQSREAQKLVEKEIQQDHSVNPGQEDQKAGSIRDQGKGDSSPDSERGDKKRDKEKKETSPVRGEVPQDPELGHFIDISG